MLANALRSKLRILISSQPRLGEQVEVYAINALAERLYRLNLGAFTLASSEQIGQRIEEAASEIGESRFALGFMQTEWERVVDAWQLDTWDAYRVVPRLGRRRSLPETQRKALWSIFQSVRAGLKEDGADHPRPDVRPTCAPVYRNAAVAVRFCHRRRVPGCRRITTALSASPRHEQSGRSLLHRRPRPAHLPATILMAGARHRNPWTSAHPQGQLPHLASDQEALRSPAGPGHRRRRRQHRRAPQARYPCSTAPNQP